MRIIVQKFGGTSVATPELRSRVVAHVERAVKDGLRPVVVVSAMGRAGAPYATDTLIQTARQNAARLCAREMDALMACGETISSSLLSQILMSHGLDSVSLSGQQAGIITDECFGQARILAVKPERILQALSQGKVVVVAGFQGVTESGDTTTLGRGGSDTTAAALGVALGAVAVEIYTDVDGVKTADPRLVPEAKTLEQVTYREVAELAHLGAKVIHPRAVEIAMEGRVPLKVLAIASDGPGTLIWDGKKGAGAERIAGDKVVTGITHIPGMAHVVVRPENGVRGAGIALAMFERVAEKGISIDLIHVTPERVAFIVPEDRAAEVRENLSDLGMDSSVEPGFAKVSAVGAGMHGVPGVMVRVMGALSEAGVRVYETADSHANISCLVRAEDVEKAVQALHRQFDLAAM
ncbi:MAG: aspartate kinase [Firmicutes bacterium]|nr:aspartate kinase [Bacillota bacterium]